MTGLLIFFAKGSVMQLVLASIFTMMYGFGVAWAMPYKVNGANLLKIGTECALLGTLIISMLLKIDLDEEGVPEVFVGVLLVFTNIGLPGTSLAIGLMSLTGELSEELKDSAPGMASFENPVSFEEEEEEEKEDITQADEQQEQNPLSIDDEEAGT